jgi:hypothetical protein
MQHDILITEEILHSQSDFAESQGLIPELLFRLIAASVGNPTGLRIPFGGSVNQSGLDGLLVSPVSFEPYIPREQSIWEIGTSSSPQDKATNDFEKRTKQIPKEDRAFMTFVFVTTRSAAHSWSDPNQREWLKKRIGKKAWKDVQIIDGSKMVQWLYHFPEISLWLADKFHIPIKGVDSPALHWKILERFGSPPNLKPNIFLIGRDKAKEDVLRIFRGETTQLLLETKYPEEGIDFVVAVLASLDEAQSTTFTGRCLIIRDVETWKGLCSLRIPHVLVAEPSLDLGGTGIDLLQHALTYKHAVIYARVPTGASHGNSTSLGETKPYDLAKGLEACGYAAERARMISDRCGGRIPVLKRLLSNLSASPEWASTGVTSELSVALLIGQWDGKLEGDREAVEGILGKAYGEWLGRMRPTTLQPDPPLSQRDEKWRFISRFEGWEVLGGHLSNSDLDRFQSQALKVLGAKDPKFSLPPEERWRASTYDEKPKYSETIKVGIAETLALLGARPNALTSCSIGKPESIAAVTVRDVLKDADWISWATLNDVLPLLAEASPEQFLNVIEDIQRSPARRIFSELFSQEGSGIVGWNYMTGVLWALETLAWQKDYLTRVAVILARLSEIDPGGQWANRPFGSLTTIFLPWLPQTCAPVHIRSIAVEAILQECPKIGWKLLLALLPNTHQVTSGSRKPSWREFIPIDRSEKVSTKEYFEQVAIYTSLAIQVATADMEKLSEIITRLDDLPQPAHADILKHLTSNAVLSLPEEEKARVWEALVDVVVKHRKFADAHWAMPAELVDKIVGVAEALRPSAPQLVHRRLFCQKDFELLEDRGGDYQHQMMQLSDRRVEAIKAIVSTSGIEGVLGFAASVTDTQQVGIALGQVALDEYDSIVLPSLLLHREKRLQNFASGYVWSRFGKNGWPWVDKMSVIRWSEEEQTTFLTLLPFDPQTWKRVEVILNENEHLYWKKVDARPYQLKDALPEAVKQLLDNGRPRAAIQCLDWMLHEKMQISVADVHRALRDNLTSQEPAYSMDQYACIELIQWMQGNIDPDNDVLYEIEWAYLPLLDRQHGLAPKTLEWRLAEHPEFFCEAIQLVFRSHKEEESTEDPSEERKRIAANAYDLLYKWQTPPGSTRSGTFSAELLKAWLDEVKLKCEASGHIQIALAQVGRVLAHSPIDPKGLWIHKGSAEVLNAEEHGSMRSAFTVELFNERGVHGWSAGKEESTIAAGYREKADAVEKEGYHRFAAALRELATSYELDATREASRDPFDR